MTPADSFQVPLTCDHQRPTHLPLSEDAATEQRESRHQDSVPGVREAEIGITPEQQHRFDEQHTNLRRVAAELDDGI